MHQKSGCHSLMRQNILPEGLIRSVRYHYGRATGFNGCLGRTCTAMMHNGAVLGENSPMGCPDCAKNRWMLCDIHILFSTLSSTICILLTAFPSIHAKPAVDLDSSGVTVVKTTDSTRIGLRSNYLKSYLKRGRQDPAFALVAV